MDIGLIKYLKTYEQDVYNACLMTDFVDLEGGEGYTERCFDYDVWMDFPANERAQIESEYLKFKNGSFEDYTIESMHHKRTCGFH